MTLPELAIRRHVTTLMLLVSLVVLGAVALTRLPLAFLPDVEEPQLFVRLPYESASPEQVERMVVRPVEDALGSVKGLDSMWSMCNDEGGRIRLQFDWGTDIDLARVEVWEKIDRVRGELPDDLGDILVSADWGGQDSDRPVLEGRLSSRQDLSESYDLLDRRIIRPLERVPGVAAVRLDGVNPREVRIDLRLADLERHRIDVRRVSQALRGGNFDMSLGEIHEGDRRFTARTVGTFDDVQEIRDLPLRADGLRLRDVADVTYSEPPLEYGRHLDGNFAVGITVTAEANANSVEVCEELERRIDAMGDDPELQGVNFLVWFSQGAEIEKSLADLAFTGVFGAVLASVILFLFLRRFSSTVISALSIPFSLVVTCGIIWAQGKTLNTLTLLGLIVGIGMLVDNAVVVIENIFRHQEDGRSRRDAARIGAREVSTAVTAATLTSVIVFLPIIFNRPSEMNLYLKELGITVCITLLVSLFISQTLIPMATSWFVKSRPKGKGRLILWLEERYVRVLRFNLRHRWITPMVGLLTIASIVYPFQHVDMNFDTNESELFVQVSIRPSENLSLERKEALVTDIEQSLEPHREALMARSIYSFWNERWALIRIYLHEGEATPDNLAQVRQELRDLLPEVAGVELQVLENRQHWRQDRGKRVAFQVVGEDSEVLARLAEEIQLRLAEIPGLIEPFSSSEQGGEEIHVQPDRDLASLYGVNPTQISEVVGLTYRGRRLPRYRTEEGEREMRLTLEEQDEESIQQLRNLPLWTEEGEEVPVASVARLEKVPGAERIQRDDRRTSIWVGAQYEEGTREEYMPLVAQALAGVDFPFGYSWTWGRWQERSEQKRAEFQTNLILALLLIFAVMAGLFESVRQAIGLMVALPFAIAGAMWTLYFTGVDFDQPAAVGLLLLIGIVVNNGIVMIEHINQYRRGGMARDEAMLLGGRQRLRPILMTASTTLIGLVPIIVQKPALGGVYYYSMAWVLMGGLFLSTFLTTILLPTTITIVEDTLGWAGRTALWLPRRIGRGGRAERATRAG